MIPDPHGCVVFLKQLSNQLQPVSLQHNGLVCNKTIFWSSAKDSHFPPISMHRNPKAAKAVMLGRRWSADWQGRLGFRAWLPRTGHILMRLRNQTFRGPHKFLCSNLALICKRGGAQANPRHPQEQLLSSLAWAGEHTGKL